MQIRPYETNSTPERSFLDLIKDLLSSNPSGILGNTVFSAPRAPWEYDSAATTASRFRKNLYDTYTDPVAANVARERMLSIDSQLGLGGYGQKVGQFIYNNLSSEAVERIIGHHGGQKAQDNIIHAADAIGATRTGVLGSLANPRQMNENLQQSLRFALDAYKNNFNKYGEVDINQTHGLTLDQATMISTAALQSESQYNEFAKNAKEKNPQLSQEEIDRFRSGVGTSKAVADAFSTQIKEFSAEINKFVASVSKMTGDFEETINFMQKATGGKLFDAGKDADQLRKDAVRMATNMRIIAADSGMNVQELYMKSGLMGGVFDAAQGRTNELASMFASKAASTRLGMIGAAAYARWAHGNPNATKEQRDAAVAGISGNIADYGQGDMSKMTVVLGRLVDEGVVSKEEAEELVRSGNATQTRAFLAKKLGGESRLDSFLDDGRAMSVWKRHHGRTIADLDTIGLSESLANERREKGERELLATELRLVASRAGASVLDNTTKEEALTKRIFHSKTTLEAAGMTEEEAKAFSEQAEKEGWDRDTTLRKFSEKGHNKEALKRAAVATRAQEVEDELDKLTNAAFRNKETLTAAGMTEEEAKAFSEQAEKEGWDRDRVIDEASEYGPHVNTQRLSKAAARTIVDESKKSDLLTQDERERVEAAYRSAYGRDVTAEDNRKAARIVASRRLSTKIELAQDRWKNAGSDDERRQILTDLSALYEQAYAGENGLSLASTPEANSRQNIDAILEQNMTFSGDTANNPDLQKKVIAAAREAYSAKYTETGNEEEAFAAAEAKAKEYDGVTADYSRKNREATVRKDIELEALEGIVNSFFSTAVGGSSETRSAERRKALQAVTAEYKKLRTEKPDASAEQLYREAIVNTDVNPVDENGFSLYQGGLVAYTEQEKDVVNNAVGRVYVERAKSIGYTSDADIKLTDEKAQREAAKIADQLARGENIDDVNAMSAGSHTEDAADAAVGMGRFTAALEDAVKALNDLVSSTRLVKADTKDAAAQGTAFLQKRQLTQRQRVGLIGRHGLGDEFASQIDFNRARGVAWSSGASTQNPDQWVAEKSKAVIDNLRKNKADLTDDKAVLDEVEKEMGAEARKFFEDELARINEGKKDNDPTKIGASQLVTGYSVGPNATKEEISNAVLEQTLKDSGLDDLDPEVKKLVQPIREMTEKGLEETKQKLKKIIDDGDIDWSNPDEVIQKVSDVILGEENDTKTDTKTEKPDAQASEATTTAEGATPSIEPVTAPTTGTPDQTQSQPAAQPQGVPTKVQVVGIDAELSKTISDLLAEVRKIKVG